MEDHRLAGFTLFELLVTMALAGILAALAVPAFSDLIQTARMRSAAEMIADDLRKTRRNAVLKNTPQQVTIQHLSNQHWSYSNGTALSKKTISSADYPNIALARPAFSASGLIRFTPVRGTANAGRLDFSTSSNKHLSVILSPLGRVRLCSDNDARYHAC